MRKTTLKTILIILIFCLILTVAACGESGDNKQPPAVTVTRIEVDKSSIPVGAFAGALDLSVLRLNVYKSDDTSNTISISDGMIKIEDRTKLSKAGTHMIAVIYEGRTTKFQITLVNRDKAQYVLRIYNGIPTKINDTEYAGEDVVGEYYEGIFDEGTVVTMEWIPVQGYTFESWTDNDKFIDSQSITVVTMLEDHVYRAFSATVINKVSFVTNCEQGIGVLSTNTLHENALPTLVKDGYVFDGWTTSEVTGDAAIDTNDKTVKKIAFPYNVRVETVLYGTWRVLGLEYLDFRTAAGTVGYKVVDYVRNDLSLSLPEMHAGKPIVAISADALNKATKLEQLTIPKTVEIVESGFVRNCARLKDIKVDMDNRNFTSESGVLFNYLGNELIAYPSAKLNAQYVVDSGVEKIADYAFYNAVIGGIELPSQMKSAGDYAFNTVHADYISFVSVNPTQSGFVLGDNLFDPNITHILIDGAYRTHLEKFDGIKVFSDRIVTNADVLPTLGINADKTLIYKEIINENSDNQTTTIEIIGADRSVTLLRLPVNIGYSVSSIGVRAFNGCIYLTTFELPIESRLERVLTGAFDGTPWLEKLPGKIFIANSVLYKYFGTAETYSLPANISKIAEQAFYNNKTLKYIDLSKNTELGYIGAHAFYGCEKLTGGINGDGLTLKAKMRTIGNFAFAHTALIAFKLPNGSVLETIGIGAFQNCTYLTAVEIGVETSEISTDAFLYCSSIQAFNVQSNAKKFISFDGVLYQYGYGDPTGSPSVLFAYPAGLMSAEFDVAQPSKDVHLTVKSIGEFAFFHSNIAALSIPSSVTNIHTSAFYLPGLVYVRFAEMVGRFTYSNLFVSDDRGLGKFVPEYVTVTNMTPDSSEQNLLSFFGNDNILKNDKYKIAVTETFAEENGMILRLFDTHASVVKTLRNVPELTVPETVGGKNVTDIAPYAFVGVYLETLHLGSKISKIGQYALSNVPSLTKLYTVQGMSIPTVSENTFGKNFGNGLYIYITIETTDAYLAAWGLTDNKYLIDLKSELPVATFAFLPGEDSDPIAPMKGTISPEDAPIPVKDGYEFEGWYDENNNKIDFSMEYKIPYNITLFCHWAPMEFTVYFNIGQSASMESKETKVRYGEDYIFETPIYDNNSKKLILWRTVNGTQIATVGNWSYLGEQTVHLYPVWEDVDYILIFDTADGVTVSGTRQSVKYGEYFTLPIPSKVGYVFQGWTLQADKGIFLTDMSGQSLLPWEENGKEEYTVYPLWVVKKDIQVNLYFTNGVRYRTLTVVFGEKFEFAYDTALIEDDQWIRKADIFCGWYSTFDTTTQSGNGTRYTDETGKGLFTWDRGETTNLYAQWPLEISSGADLENLADMNRSVVLIQDITVTKPIGSLLRPYTGTFNGNGKTVTFTFTLNDNSAAIDGAIGLFAYNKGTVKNFKLVANITVETTNSAMGKPLYVGAVAGINEGKITNEGNSELNIKAQIRVNVTANATLKTHVGGIAGANNGGTISHNSMQLENLIVTINGAKPETSSAGICVGTVVGTLNGGAISDNGKTNIYCYTEDGDPYRSMVCGENKLATDFTYIVTSSKV